jgi:hypothetical protein
MDILENIMEALPQAQAKRQQQATCGYDGAGPGDVFYVTVFTNATPTTKYNWNQGTNTAHPNSAQIADIPINLPFPCRKFRLVSVEGLHGGTLQAFLSLTPTGLAYDSGGLFVEFPTGVENWFAFEFYDPANGSLQSKLFLRNKVDKIFLTCFDAKTTQGVFTIACYNDAIDDESVLGAGIN